MFIMYRFSKAKSEALVNDILVVYSNKKLKSCNAKPQRQRERQKTIGLISKKKKKKTTLHVQKTFLHIALFSTTTT